MAMGAATPMTMTAQPAQMSAASAPKGGYGGGSSPTCPTGSQWGNPGNYCMSGSIYYCSSPGAYGQMTNSCGGNGCYVAPPGTPDGCNTAPSTPTCPTGSAWGNPGNYCLDSRSIYYCSYPGANGNLVNSCGNNGCYRAPPGVPDACNAPSAPTPYPTKPPTKPAMCYSRPQWYGGNACDQFGDFKGKDLAWQVCQNSQMSSYGGGMSSCQYWQNQQCYASYDNYINQCCPEMRSSSMSQQTRNYCNAS